MSFLSDTVLSSSARLHTGREGEAGQNDGLKRTSQSPAGLLTPLIQLVRDPFGTKAGEEIVSRAPVERPAVTEDADRKQVLYLRMRNAESYDDWKAAATELDSLEGNDAWKLEDESPEYDAALVKARLEQLDDARLSCDVQRMLFLIRTSLTRGLGGMGHLRMYKHSHVGTKKLIERYIDSAVQTLNALHEVSAKQGDRCPVDHNVIMQGLLHTRQSFGRTALLLSGGGTFGMNHIGVVKSLWEMRLLPRIVSGASAGSIVCAILCSKTDTEIPAVLHEFCYGDLNVFEKVGDEDSLMRKATRFLKYGSLFDISHLMRVMKNMLGDITFQESYNRTRRILNITVSSASMYELPRLLNYITAPDVMIWSAVCASCSVPFIFSAASLLAKDRKTGKEVPWNPTPNAGWIDGSVDNDLPMTRLAEMFNVNHFIVSQVNPHVVPFLAKEENVGAEMQQSSALSAGPSWMHNMASFAKSEALHRLDVLAEMGILPNAVTKARSILNQRYSGDITIFPTISYSNFPKILSNPTTEFMLRCMLTGEQATWPKLSRIQNHVAIEIALDEAVHNVRDSVAFSQSQVDLRLNNLHRPLSQGNDVRPMQRVRLLHKSTRFGNGTAPSTPSMEMTSPAIPRRSHPRIKLPPKPAPAAKPYLPTHPSRRGTRSLDINQLSSSNVDAVSSSTNPDGSSSDGDFSTHDESDTTESLSSHSPPNSPSRQMPTLWPSTRQVLFPSSSQPATPSLTATGFGHRSSSSLNITMTSTAPSSPELRYKRLFHPPVPSPVLESEPVAPEIQQEIERTMQPLAQTYPALQQTESVPEDQRAPPAPSVRTDSLNEAQIRAFDAPALSPVISPSTTRDEAKANVKKKLSQHDIKATERSRRDGRRGSAQGAGLGLMLDISGTRGMMLRKKGSRGGSSAAS